MNIKPGKIIATILAFLIFANTAIISSEKVFAASYDYYDYYEIPESSLYYRLVQSQKTYRKG